MEWNERELAWLNKKRNFIETHDFTDIRIELGGEMMLDLHEKKHLMAGIAISLGLNISLEIEPGSIISSRGIRTRLCIIDPTGGKQRLALNDYNLEPNIDKLKKDYLSDLVDLGCSQKLASEVMNRAKVNWR